MDVVQKKQRALARIAAELARNSSCPLRRGATQPVPGEGNPDADVLFVGEAPGANEDKTGRPFVGAAGKVLTGLLESIGLRREDVFITSVEKFRPPKNRDPKPGEIRACLPYLERQIAVIEPRIIVPLGRHALATLLAWDAGSDAPVPFSLERMHGKVVRGKRGLLFVPMYHPAALFYNNRLRATIERDFRAIKRTLRRHP